MVFDPHGTAKHQRRCRSTARSRFSFTDARTCTLIWPGGSIPIQRFDTIIGSGNGITPAFVPENGWWWNEAESGRGFFMDYKNNFAFIAGYMYEADGKPFWYTAQ